MTKDPTAELIKKHEGFRDRIYTDTTGHLTVGWGSCLYEGKQVPVYVCERLFYEDYTEAYRGYESLDLALDTVRRAVVVNMIFNLGLEGFKGFKNTIAYIRMGDYCKAASNMLKSLWARQVKGRAVELARMMETGEWPEYLQ